MIMQPSPVGILLDSPDLVEGILDLGEDILGLGEGTLGAGSLGPAVGSSQKVAALAGHLGQVLELLVVVVPAEVPLWYIQAQVYMIPEQIQNFTSPISQEHRR